MAQVEKWKCDILPGFLSCGGPLWPKCPPKEGCGFNELKSLICNLVRFFAYCLAEVAAIVGIMIGGYHIMFAAGDPGKIEFGKKAIFGSIVGLLIVFLAQAVIAMFLNL